MNSRLGISLTGLGIAVIAAVTFSGAPSAWAGDVSVSVGYHSWGGYGYKGPHPHPAYVYVAPPPQVVYVQPAPQQVVVVQQPAPTTATVTTDAPPPYGSRIGNTTRVQSPYSNFQIDTTNPRDSVIYDVNTGQPFRIP